MQMRTYFGTGIIWMRRPERLDKLFFKVNYAFNKDQTAEIYYVMAKISDSIA